MKKFMMAILIVVITLTLPLAAGATNLKSAQQQKSTIDSKIKDVSKQKQEVLGEKKKLETENKSLANTQNAENAEYNQLVDEVKALETELVGIDDVIKESEENYQTQKEVLKTRLRAMSENSGYSLLETLIKSKSLTEFFERLELISLISKKDKQIVETLKIAKQEVEYKKQLKEDEKTELAGKAIEKRERITNLKASRAELEQQIRESKAKLEKLEKQEDQLYKQSKEMDSVIKNLTKKTPYIGGNMQWPTPGNTRVVSAYGSRKHPILKTVKMHTGIDIDADKGDDIVAANKGTVIISKYQNGYGNTVVIDHGGGITTLYAHCSKLLVKVGAEVKAGQKIALVGSTGLSTGPHLHFEVRKNGKTQNPLSSVK